MYGRLMRGLGVAVLVILTVTLNIGGCGPGLGLISRNDEVRMGRQAATQFEGQYGGLSRDPRITVLTSGIGTRITRAAIAGDYYDYPYEFRPLNNSKVNANAFPGGMIYLWSGLFQALEFSEDQLAWVAGHEAAHVARQHAVRRMERSVGYDLIIQLALGRGDVGKIASIVAGLTLQDYGRDQELEADRLGSAFTRSAGYDPTAGLGVLETFKRLQGRDPSDFEIFFATHPGNTEREDRLKAYFKEQGWSGKYFTP